MAQLNEFDGLFVNIEGSSSLIRDTYSMGVVNTNKSAYEAATTRKQKTIKEREKVTSLENEVQLLKQKLDELLSKTSTQQFLVG